MKADTIALHVNIYLSDHMASTHKTVSLTFTVLCVFISALFYDATSKSVYAASNDNMTVKKKELECGRNRSWDNLHLPGGREETTKTLSDVLWDEI